MLILTPPPESAFKRWFPDPKTLPLDREECAARLQHAFESFAIEGPLTVDEHDDRNPRKHLDLYGDLQYLRIPIYGFFRYSRVNWCKSRKTLATITLTEYATWHAHMWENRRVGWVAMKQDDGAALVEEYIKQGYLESLPKWWHKKWKYGKSKGNLVIDARDDEPWHSVILAYPSGADQLRQFAHSLVVVDEAHTFPDLFSMLQGIDPGLQARPGVAGGQRIMAFVARRGSPVLRYLGKYWPEAVRLSTEQLSPLGP